MKKNGTEYFEQYKSKKLIRFFKILFFSIKKKRLLKIFFDEDEYCVVDILYKRDVKTQFFLLSIVSSGIQPKPYDGRRWSAVYTNTIYIYVYKHDRKAAFVGLLLQFILSLLLILLFIIMMFILLMFYAKMMGVVTECMVVSPE